jgi:hypothetical protein
MSRLTTRDHLEKLFGDIQNRLNWFTATALAKSYNVSPTTVTNAIAQMEHDGWQVTRRRDQNNVLYNVIRKGTTRGTQGQPVGATSAGTGEVEQGAEGETGGSAGDSRGAHKDTGKHRRATDTD